MNKFVIFNGQIYMTMCQLKNQVIKMGAQNLAKTSLYTHRNL